MLKYFLSKNKYKQSTKFPRLSISRIRPSLVTAALMAFFSPNGWTMLFHASFSITHCGQDQLFDSAAYVNILSFDLQYNFNQSNTPVRTREWLLHWMSLWRPFSSERFEHLLGEAISEHYRAKKSNQSVNLLVNKLARIHYTCTLYLINVHEWDIHDLCLNCLPGF